MPGEIVFEKRAPGFDLSEIDLAAVGALIVTPDRRYLMQLRTDKPHVAMHGHWGVFGGLVEPGESPEQALARELAEELELRPARATWFTELVYCLHQVGRRFHRKYFYEVPIAPGDIERLRLHEGDGMKLFDAAALFREERIVPWDSMAILLHDRRERVFGAYRAPDPPGNG